MPFLLGLPFASLTGFYFHLFHLFSFLFLIFLTRGGRTGGGGFVCVVQICNIMRS